MLNNRHCFLTSFQMALWAASRGFFTHALISKYPAKITFFLCAAPSSLVFCPKNCSCHGLQRVFTLSPYLGSPLSFNSVSPPCTIACKLLQGRKTGPVVELTLFPFRIFILHCLIHSTLQTIISHIFVQLFKVVQCAG